jgi:hypothetical protein
MRRDGVRVKRTACALYPLSSTLRQLSFTVVCFAPARSTSIQDVAGLHDVATRVQGAPNGEIVALFVAARENNAGARN